MKINKLLLAMIVTTIFSLGLVSATHSMSAPVAGGNYSTTLSFTLSISYLENTGLDAMDNMTNVTCWYDAAGGAAETYLTSWANTSAGTTVGGTGSVTISSLTDATAYNISCQVGNNSAGVINQTISVARVTLDSTDPVCVFTRDHRTMVWKGIQLVTWTSTDALSLISTDVIIDRPEAADDMTYTDANKELTLTSQDTKYVGSWSATLGALDRAANSCNESLTWKTYMPSEDGVLEPSKIPGWLIVVGIIAIIWFISKKK